VVVGQLEGLGERMPVSGRWEKRETGMSSSINSKTKKQEGKSRDFNVRPVYSGGQPQSDETMKPLREE